MTTDVIPVLRVADVEASVAWYKRLGFEKTFEHRFEPGFRAYVGIRREGTQMHLSEHSGDATANTLVYVWIDDLDGVATEFGVHVDEQSWASEAELVDPDGNRLRLGQSTGAGDRQADAVLGDGTTAVLVDLETAMWRTETRADRAWMEAHLTDGFTEFGYSGRTYSRAEILDVEVGPIDADLHGSRSGRWGATPRS